MIRDMRKLALQQLSDYQNNNPGTCFDDLDFILNMNSAYELQDTVTDLRVTEGEDIIGYKVGCTGSGTTGQFGMNGPIRGTLFDSELLRNESEIDFNLFTNLAIEGEMAVTIGANVEIISAFPVIELHNFVFRAPIKTLPELIANNGFNAGVVCPDLTWQGSTQYINQSAQLSVKINSEIIATGDLWPLPQGPSGSIEWLENNLKSWNRSILPGNIILTGTSLGLYPVQPGDKIEVSINNETAVSCKVSAKTKTSKT